MSITADFISDITAMSQQKRRDFFNSLNVLQNKALSPTAQEIQTMETNEISRLRTVLEPFFKNTIPADVTRSQIAGFLTTWSNNNKIKNILGFSDDARFNAWKSQHADEAVASGDTVVSWLRQANKIRQHLKTMINN